MTWHDDEARTPGGCQARIRGPSESAEGRLGAMKLVSSTTTEWEITMPYPSRSRVHMALLGMTASLMVLSLGLASQPAYASYVWHVATGGDDVAGDGSATLPFATIAHALAQAASGDTIALFDGIHSGAGNVNVTWIDKDMHFRSVSGSNQNCVIDCAGASGFDFTLAFGGAPAHLSFTGLGILGASVAIRAEGQPPWSGPPVEVSLRKCRLSGGGNGLAILYGSAGVDSSSISGNTGAAIGVEQGGLTLHEDVIRNNGTGIHFEDYSFHPLTAVNVQLVANGVGIDSWQEFNDFTLTSCRVDSSGSHGIRVGSSESGRITLIGCSVVGNGGHGAVIRTMAAISANNSQISGNALNGVAVEDGFYGFVSLNGVEVINNGGWGIWEQPGAMASPIDILGCTIRDNHSGGVAAAGGTEVTGTLVADNGGPGIRMVNTGASQPRQIEGVTIAGNAGAGVVVENCTVAMDNVLVAANTGVSIDLQGTGFAQLACCDLYGNSGGDWIGGVAGQAGTNGNIAADPLLCSAQSSEDPWSLQTNSPCAPEYSPACGLIGARPVGCPPPYAGPVWNVATDGDDETGDGSAALPFSTIARALAIAASGDTIALFDGTYLGTNNVNVTWTDKGMHFRSVSGDNEHCVIDCSGAAGFDFKITSGTEAVSLSFTGIAVLGASVAIKAEGKPQWSGGPRVDVSLRKCRLSGGGDGLTVLYGTAVVDSSSIMGNGGNAIGVQDAGVVLHDDIIRNNGTGLECVDRSASSLTITNVQFVGNGLGIHSSVDLGTGVALTSCRVDSSSADGIHFHGALSGAFVLNACSVVGNVGHGIVLSQLAFMSVYNSQISGNGLNGVTISLGDTARPTEDGTPRTDPFVNLDGVNVIDNGGWGIWEERASYPVFGVHACTIRNNHAGGIAGFADVTNTLIVDNGGPGVVSLYSHVSSQSRMLEGITIAGNRGAGVIVENCTVVMNNVVVAANTGVSVDLLGTGFAQLACCDLYGNSGGDWVGAVAPQAGTNGNFAEDPLFCGAGVGEFSLADVSPCLPGQHPDGVECGLIGALGQGCTAAPRILSVRDVGNDQGRQIRLRWLGSGLDDPRSTDLITGYGIYRRQDQYVEASGQQTDRSPAVHRGDRRLDGWDYISTVPARGDSVYQVVVPTLCDSTAASGICWSVFFVEALTGNVFRYFDSPPDSGYSVDNLAPGSPGNFRFSQLDILAWDEASDPDFDYFTVFGSADSSLGPAADTIGYTVSTSFSVSGHSWAYYHVTASDFAGNRSDPSTIQFVADAPGAGAGAPEHFYLYQNQPNPVNGATTIRFDCPEAAQARLWVFDVSGRLVTTLVDRQFLPGSHTVTWSGCGTASGLPPAGIYFYRLETESFVQTRKLLLFGR
jgi:hypothetical protein